MMEAQSELETFDFALSTPASATSPHPPPAQSPNAQDTLKAESFDASQLADSPEHPDFTPSWTSSDHFAFTNDTLTHGTSRPSAPVPNTPVASKGIHPVSELELNSGVSIESMHPWQNVTDHMPPCLSHQSSTTSLHSLASSGLLVDVPESTDPSMQRDSATDDKVFDAHAAQMWTMPTQGHAQTQGTYSQPSLHLQTQGLGRAMGRPRSMSRVQPYGRERSESVSNASEGDEDITALLSAASSHSQLQTPWSGQIVGSMNKMSIHHRRTSSNLSSMSTVNSPMRTSLARAHRSSSYAIKSKPSLDLQQELRLVGSAEERENTVRTVLSQQAERFKAIPPGTQQDKMKTLWVRQWLQLSYSYAPGSTVPRQGLYHSYTLSCEEYNVRPINSASFGKAVRSAYPGIKTRRLGHRGNSKYHYVSLRPAIRIEAVRLNEFGDSSGHWHVAPEDGTMGFEASTTDTDMSGEDVDEADVEDEDDVFGSSYAPFALAAPVESVSFDRPVAMTRRHTTSAAVPWSGPEVHPVYELPTFPKWDLYNLGDIADTAMGLWGAYCQHLEALVGCFRSLRFDQFEVHCRNFWVQRTPRQMQAAEMSQVSPKLDEALAVTYDHLLSILMGKLLTQLSSAQQQALRKLSSNLETILEQSMSNFSPTFCEPKIELSVRAGHLYNRFVELYQITIALSPILSDPTQVKTMVAAWGHIDSAAIADQCALSCNCEPEISADILGDFFGWLLSVQSSPGRGNKAIETLGKWVDKRLDMLQDGPLPARSIISRSGFLTSQVVRDFTLRSDQAFGLFQMLKTWLDDYVSISILRKSALSSSSLDLGSSGMLPQSMSVMIPPPSHHLIPGTYNDLSTAVPIGHGSSFGQFLGMPFGETVASTPRAAKGGGEA